MTCELCVCHRLTIHMDEELRGLAFTTLQALMVDFCDWREDVLSGFVYFIVREVTDVHPTLLDNTVKMLLQLIIQWRQAVQSSNRSQDSQVCVRSLLSLGLFFCRENIKMKWEFQLVQSERVCVCLSGL